MHLTGTVIKRRMINHKWLGQAEACLLQYEGQTPPHGGGFATYILKGDKQHWHHLYSPFDLTRAKWDYSER